MKHFKIYALGIVALAVPAVLFAQTNGLPAVTAVQAGSPGALQTLINIEEQSNILEIISLWSTLIVAFVTSMMVWVGGRQMHGGVFGRVLTFFSIGMTLIFLGFATEVPWLEKIDHLYLKMIHDSLYIIGYVMMGIAASKLLKVIKGE